MRRFSDEICKALEAFPRLDLEDIRTFFGAMVPARASKRVFVERLGAFLIERPAEWLRRMLERDLRLLARLVDAGPEVPVEVDYPDYPSVLETVHLLSTDTSDPEIQRIWISRELHAVVAPHVEAAILEGEQSGAFELDRVVLGYLNLYGAVHSLRMMSLLQAYGERSGRWKHREFVRRLKDSPALRLCRYDVDEAAYYVAPGIAEPEEVVRRWEAFPEIGQFHPFSVEDALEAGTGAPFFTFGLKTSQGRALLQMLEALGYAEDERLREAHDIWMNAQMVQEGDATEAIFASVSRIQDELPSFQEYNEAMQVIASYANSLPKWVLKGYSSDEMNLLKVILHSDTGQLDELVKQDPLLGLFVPAAPSYAPCPCGSGLSYRFCHGKYRN